MNPRLILVALLGFAPVVLLHATDIITRDGTTYKNCHGFLRSDTRVTFECSSGMVELPLAELTKPSLDFLIAGTGGSATPDGKDAGITGKIMPDPGHDVNTDQVPTVADLNLSIGQVTPDGVVAGIEPLLTPIFLHCPPAGLVVGGELHCRASYVGTSYALHTDLDGTEHDRLGEWTMVPDTTPLHTFAPTSTPDDSLWTCKYLAYRNVVVLDHNDHEVHIASGGRTYTLKLEDLSPELKERFGFNPKEAHPSPTQDHHGMNSIGGL